MRVHTGRLILVPTAAEPLLDTAGLVTTLTEGGFIGAPLPGPGQGYLVGERFLSLITFAGCSVRIELLPPGDGSPFCHVILDGPHKTPRLLSGRNTRPPRCPACKAPSKDWRKHMEQWNQCASPQLTCAQCGAEAGIGHWNWRENAGFGDLFLRVEEVFPGEAVPTPALMDLLEQASGTGWRHFYVQD